MIYAVGQNGSKLVGKRVSNLTPKNLMTEIKLHASFNTEVRVFRCPDFEKYLTIIYSIIDLKTVLMVGCGRLLVI